MKRTGILALVVFCFMAAPAAGATLEQIGDGTPYSSPVFVTSDPGDPNRIFVVERDGAIKLTEGESTSTFLDLGSIVRSPSDPGAGGEEGLLSMAFAPDYATTGLHYVFFVNTGGDIEVDEFESDAGSADFATRRPVIEIPHPNHANHNGGQLQFGPDDLLYLATGDGGGGGDPDTNAQDLESLLGKMLRIDPADPDGDGPDSYSVPADNPFVGGPGAGEIWSYGLRNPFRFSFDRLNGALLIGDVGQGVREEVDYEPQPDAGMGDNFGWSCREGLIAYSDPSPDPACVGAGGFTDPIHDYRNDEENCAITGGYVARDPSLGDLYGRYLYADFCKGELRSLVPGLPTASCDRPVGVSVDNPSSFGEDSAGRIYVASLGGPVYRLVGDTTIDCPGSSDPDPSGGDSSPGGQPGLGDEDDVAPFLRVRAPRHQDLERGARLVCKLRVDEPGDAVARLAIVETGAGARTAPAEGKRGTRGAGAIRRFRLKEKSVRPGVVTSVRWRLRRSDVRAVRRAKGKGESVQARFRVRARDAAGNRGPKTELRSRLG